jgi:predicted Zn-dependent protease
VAWNLTLAGTALAAAGDTAALRALADSVEHTGRGSIFGRDAQLHHFLRGLLLQREGRHEDAVVAFRRAMFSTTDGYTRINLMLAHSLQTLGRASEAVEVLQAALRGGVDGSNTYVTHTDLHLALADAFAAAGQRDSASVHYRAVELAWREADPAFSDRYRRAVAAARAGEPAQPGPASGRPHGEPG